MACLIYIINASLDGYTEDRQGKFDWSEPDDEQFKFITDLIREAGTYLYGRRMYESMMVWETQPDLALESPLRRDFAQVWQAAGKIVYSRMLETPSTRKTHIEHSFNPEVIRQLKAAGERDILIGGPELAAQALRAELVDEYHLFVGPVSLGGGKRALPEDVRLELELLEERRFENGVVFLRYHISKSQTIPDA